MKAEKDTGNAVLEFEEAYFHKLKNEGNDLRCKGAWQTMYGYFIDKVFKIRNKTVLDIGCAFGSIPSAFADYGAKAIGVDISEYATSMNKFSNIKLINTPAWDLSEIKDNSIDFIHSMYTFEFIPVEQREKLFSEMKRVCKHDALIFAILQMGIGKKDSQIHLSQKYEWDELAANCGMLDGSRLYYNKLMDTSVPGWEFMKLYQWPFLVYKVVKN